jgi:hypothetical protein
LETRSRRGSPAVCFVECCGRGWAGFSALKGFNQLPMETKAKDRQLSKSDLLGILGVIVGVVGVFLSVYTYQLSREVREPYFIVDSLRTEILTSKNIKEAPIRVTSRDGREVKSDVTSLRFYFWNNGKAAIHKGDVLEGLVISLDDKKGKILDYKLLKTSRHVTQLDLKRIGNLQELGVSFDILEHNDGFVGQMIYEGNPNAKLKISGVVEGAQIISQPDSLLHMELWKAIFEVFACAIFWVLWFIFSLKFLSLPKWAETRLEKVFDWLADKFGWPFIVLFVVVLLGTTIWWIVNMCGLGIQTIRNSQQQQQVLPDTLPV